jgi:V8-like Glu-specific endopeptidase
MQQQWWAIMEAMAGAGLLRKMVTIASTDPAKAGFKNQFLNLLEAENSPDSQDKVDTQPKPEQPATQETLENLIFGQQRDTRLPFAFFERARTTARSVARLAVPRIFGGVADGKFAYGTGWIIAPGILITNHHVIAARAKHEPPAKPEDFEAQAQQVVARFDYFDKDTLTYLECKNAKLLAKQPQPNLDYALIEVAEAEKIADREPLHLVPVQPTLVRGTRMNIVQHPGEDPNPMRFAVRNNFYVSPGNKPSLLWYQTDTERGASGSPVCDDDWQVVALHHSAQPVPPQAVQTEEIDGEPEIVKVLNEAIKVHDILNDLPAEVKERIDKAQKTKQK